MAEASPSLTGFDKVNYYFNSHLGTLYIQHSFGKPPIDYLFDAKEFPDPVEKFFASFSGYNGQQVGYEQIIGRVEDNLLTTVDLELLLALRKVNIFLEKSTFVV